MHHQQLYNSTTAHQTELYVLCNKYICKEYNTYIHTYIHTPPKGGMYVCMYVLCNNIIHTYKAADARSEQIGCNLQLKEINSAIVRNRA